MRTKVLLVVAALLMAIVSTVAIGSNMGFKISIPITAGAAKYVSIPFYNSFTDADSLRNDVIAAGGSNVTVYNWNGSSWQRWAGGGTGQVNFTISPGDSYEIVSSSGFSWIVVGSHNPSLAVSITAGAAKYVSLPYHSTVSTADALRNEVIAAGGSNVTVYNWNGSAWERWAGGGTGQVNFTLVPGNGYEIVSSTGLSWIPAHY